MYANREPLPDRRVYVPMSQGDYWKELDVSNVKRDSIFKQLDEDDLVHLIEGKRGKYILTSKTITIIKETGKIENK